MSEAKEHMKVGDVKSQIKATKGINAESKGWWDGVKMKISEGGINR